MLSSPCVSAAAEADAVLVITSYRGRVPSMAHNAIDWLTRRWRHGALHDKPLAVIGRSAGCYSGVWSRQVEGHPWRFGTPSDRAIDSARLCAKRSRSSQTKCTEAALLQRFDSHPDAN